MQRIENAYMFVIIQFGCYLLAYLSVKAVHTFCTGLYTFCAKWSYSFKIPVSYWEEMGSRASVSGSSSWDYARIYKISSRVGCWMEED